MNTPALFGLSILMSFIAFGNVTKIYIWPRLRVMPREDGLIALLVPHIFRFVGLSFLVPGVLSPSLPREFAAPAAYGDLVAAVLAMIAMLALWRRASWAVAIVWVFNVWGTLEPQVGSLQWDGSGWTMDAADTAAPETRYCGRSQALLYKEVHPHKTLEYRSPREFIAANGSS
jgi:hypothetical protein